MREVILEKCSNKKKWEKKVSSVQLDLIRDAQTSRALDKVRSLSHAQKCREACGRGQLRFHNHTITQSLPDCWVCFFMNHKTQSLQDVQAFTGSIVVRGLIENVNRKWSWQCCKWQRCITAWLPEWLVFTVISCYRLKLFKSNSIINLAVGYIFCGSVQLGLKI